jgi:hypothetical protein
MSLVPFTPPLGRLTLADADPSATEAAVIKTYRGCDDLKAKLDQLAIQVEKLVRERHAIARTLETFYRSHLRDEPSLQPVLVLALQLNPQLAASEQLRLKDTEEPA